MYGGATLVLSGHFRRWSAGRLGPVDFLPPGAVVGRTGHDDALTDNLAMRAAKARTAKGEATCVCAGGIRSEDCPSIQRWPSELVPRASYSPGRNGQVVHRPC
jgi:hypothetical protein